MSNIVHPTSETPPIQPEMTAELQQRLDAIAAVRIPVTSECYMGHLRQSDVEAIYQFTDAAIVDAGMNERWPYTMEQAQKLVDFMTPDHTNPSVSLSQLKEYCIRDVHTDQCIGIVALYVPPPSENGEQGPTQIGYLLAAAYRGRGIMTAACNVLLRIAFTQLEPPIQLLAANSFTYNIESHKVLERLHFKLDHIQYGVATKLLSNGQTVTLDEKEFRLTRDEWLERQRQNNEHGAASTDAPSSTATLQQRLAGIAAVRIPVTSECYLGHLRQSDVKAIYQFTDSAIVDAGFNERWPYTIEQAQELVDIMTKDHSNPLIPLSQLKEYCIRDAKTDQCVGVTALFVPPPQEDGTQPPTQIGYLLAAAYRGRGIATLAVHQLLRIAFTQMEPPVQQLAANSWTINPDSHRVLERLHFKLLHTNKGVVTKVLSDGQMHTLDEKEYMLTRDDWLQQQQQQSKGPDAATTASNTVHANADIPSAEPTQTADLQQRLTAIAAVRVPVTSECYMGHLRQSDVATIYNLTDGAIVDAGFNEQWPYTMEQAQQFVDFNTKDHTNLSIPINQLKEYCIRDATSDQCIGALTIYVPPTKADGTQPPTQIGYFLSAAYRSRGIMTAACQVLLRIAFTQLEPPIQLLTAGSWTYNSESHKLLERLRFTLDHIQTGVIMKLLSDGQVHTLDSKEYRLTRDEWLRHQQSA